MHEHAFIVKYAFVDEIADSVKVQGEVLFKRVLDLQVQVRKLVGVVRSELCSSHNYLFDAELLQKLMVGGSASIAKKDIFGDLAEICF